MATAKVAAIAKYDEPSEKMAAEDFRAAMRELASGVALATSVYERRRSGCAITSFVSLSLSPPSLLMCLNDQSSTLRCIRASGAFAVNVLAGRQQSLARRFANPHVRGAERFAEGDWGALETGAPVLLDALAVIDCRLETIVEHATHAIVIGSAAAVSVGGSESALVHWRSRFEALA
jgi:flavin reductase (DIM6/NTAB) family NADH-FMN oxidoreductase RutF